MADGAWVIEWVIARLTDVLKNCVLEDIACLRAKPINKAKKANSRLL